MTQEEQLGDIMDGRSREGKAYAVLTDAGELVFFRSEGEYEDEKYVRARDVLGNEYEGTVFSGIETEPWSYCMEPGWLDYVVKSARIAEGQAIAPASCGSWFDTQHYLDACDLSGLDTSNVTNMNGMFCGCRSLVAAPDTSKWDTSRVKDMGDMFCRCESLKTPPDTSKWDVSEVKNMEGVFYGCESLVTPPDTSKWDTSNVVTMSAMFADCHSLVEPPDTSKWDTSRVKDMESMFWRCDSLSRDDIPIISASARNNHVR